MVGGGAQLVRKGGHQHHYHWVTLLLLLLLLLLHYCYSYFYHPHCYCSHPLPHSPLRRHERKVLRLDLGVRWCCWEGEKEEEGL